MTRCAAWAPGRCGPLLGSLCSSSESARARAMPIAISQSARQVRTPRHSLPRQSCAARSEGSARGCFWAARAGQRPRKGHRDRCNVVVQAGRGWRCGGSAAGRAVCCLLLRPRECLRARKSARGQAVASRPGQARVWRRLTGCCALACRWRRLYAQRFRQNRKEDTAVKVDKRFARLATDKRFNDLGIKSKTAQGEQAWLGGAR